VDVQQILKVTQNIMLDASHNLPINSWCPIERLNLCTKGLVCNAVKTKV
jgi:hypothetical protein